MYKTIVSVKFHEEKPKRSPGKSLEKQRNPWFGITKEKDLLRTNHVHHSPLTTIQQTNK